MALKTFLVLAGTHTGTDGKLYRKGDKVKTEINLTEKFKNKFRLIGKNITDEELELEEGVAPKKAKKLPVPKEETEEDTDDDEDDSEDDEDEQPPAKKMDTKSFGKDVTADFDDAEDKDIQVFKGFKGYTLVKGDGTLNDGTPFKKKEDAQKFVTKFK